MAKFFFKRCRKIKEPTIKLRGLVVLALVYTSLMVAASKGFSQADTLPACSKEDSKNTIYGAECGNLTLLENPDDKLSKTIDIYVMRLPAIRQSGKAPIFFIAGGPGQASSHLAARFRHQFSDILIEHDFIFVDQRGTGKSNPLECDADFLDYIHLSTLEIEQLTIERMKNCISQFDADLRRYVTPYAVKDLEAVRRQLGYEEIFAWGGSYGSRVVIEYLRSFPQSLAGAILDGVAPVAMQLPRYSERDASIALAHIFASCSDDNSCQRAFPQLKSRWLAHLKHLKKSPKTLWLQHPRTEKPVKVYVDHFVLSSWVRLMLYSREIAPILPLAIHRATANDYSKLFSVVALAFDSISSNISEGMQSAILCTEDRMFREQARASNESYEKLIFIPPTTAMTKICTFYPDGDLSENYFQPIKSTVPTLMLSGKFDPVTPPVWAEYMVTQLTHQQHIEVPGGHHIVSSLGCAPKVIFDFITSPKTIASLDSGCMEDIKPVSFFVDNSGPGLNMENTIADESSDDSSQ